MVKCLVNFSRLLILLLAALMLSNCSFEATLSRKSRPTMIVPKAPNFDLSGSSTATEGQPYTLQLDHAELSTETILQWIINWGDGSQSILSGDTTQASHVYTSHFGTLTIQVNALDENGTWPGPLLPVQVLSAQLQVVSFTPDINGFTVRFNHPIDVNTINLYGATPLPGDVLVVGNNTGTIKGSLLFDEDGLGISFLKPGGPLASDTYNVTLKSDVDAFTSTTQGDLDGDTDGTPGGDYSASFIINAPALTTLSLPDFMRGPGQAVNVPAATGNGIPVKLTSTGDVRTLSFEIKYDSTLLMISGVVPGMDLPGGATLNSDLTQPGLIRIQIENSVNLSAGTLQIINLIAQVPTTAPYQATNRMEIIPSTILINDIITSCDADNGLHLVGYLGDADASRAYENQDVSLIQRAVLGLDSGFAAWKNISSIIVADVDPNGFLSVTDATRILQELSGNNRAEVPDIPSP